MLQDLINNVNKLRKQLSDAEKELYKYDDGYIYKVTYWRYRHYEIDTFHNAWAAEKCIEDSRDGENYIVDGIFSNNPNFKDIIQSFREKKCWQEFMEHEKPHRYNW